MIGPAVITPLEPLTRNASSRPYPRRTALRLAGLFIAAGQDGGMRKLFLLLLLLAAPALAQVDSGLDVGVTAPPYHPTHVTGPDAGSDVCPV